MKKYARQMLLPGIGEEGQKKLKSSCIAIVGVGAIGSQRNLVFEEKIGLLFGHEAEIRNQR